MKSFLMLASFIFSVNAFALGSSFTCTSETTAGDVVTISGCLDDETTTFEPCLALNESVAYVTVTKENWAGVAKMTPPVVETVKFPASLFTVQWDEELFSLSMHDTKWGQIDLASVSVEGLEANNSFTLDTKTFKNSFKVVGCTFDANY